MASTHPTGGAEHEDAAPNAPAGDGAPTHHALRGLLWDLDEAPALELLARWTPPAVSDEPARSLLDSLLRHDHASCLDAMLRQGVFRDSRSARWQLDATTTCLNRDAPRCLLVLMERDASIQLFRPEGLLALAMQSGRCPRCAAAIEAKIIGGEAAGAASASASPPRI